MRRTMVLTAFVVLILVHAVRGDVSNFTASASSSILRFQNGLEVQRDEVSQNYPGSASVMPLEISHRVDSQTTNQTVGFAAFNRVLVNDPQYNAAIPTDFIQETAIASALTDQSFRVTTQANQSRRINLLTSEFPNQAAGDTVTLNSAFTLDGAVAAIVPKSINSASGLQISCKLQINQDQQSLWTGSVNLTGNADRTVSAAPSGKFSAGDYVLAHNIVPNLGDVYILNFDDAVVPFSYTGNVGESFDLSAVLSFDFTVPGGLGAGSAFGTVPTEMIALNQELFTSSTATGTSPGTLTAKAAVPFSPAPEPASLLLLLVGIFVLRKRF